jgi:hypothetical protein
MAVANAPDPNSDKKQRKAGAPPADKTPRPEQPPAAGPHATPDLSNPEATPGAGALLPPGTHDDMGGTG